MPVEFFPFLVPIVSVLVAGLIILVPVVGITARFAFRPIVEALIKYRELERTSSREVAGLEQRVALLEQLLASGARTDRPLAPGEETTDREAARRIQALNP